MIPFPDVISLSVYTHAVAEAVLADPRAPSGPIATTSIWVGDLIERAAWKAEVLESNGNAPVRGKVTHMRSGTLGLRPEPPCVMPDARISRVRTSRMVISAPPMSSPMYLPPAAITCTLTLVVDIALVKRN